LGAKKEVYDILRYNELDAERFIIRNDREGCNLLLWNVQNECHLGVSRYLAIQITKIRRVIRANRKNCNP